MTMSWRSVALALCAALLVACATPAAPKELLDARSAYNRAQSGPAGRLNPAEVHEAKVALDQAEQAFEADAESQHTKDMAYVAQRKSEWAAATGNASDSQKQRDDAQRELQTLTQGNLAKAQAGLQQTQGELSKTKQALNMTAEQLAAEKKARQIAEKRARDAMDKLAVAAALSIKEEPRGTVIILPGSVLFASNKYDLLPAAQEKLNHVADALKNQQDESKIVVEGHTDSQGTEQSNQVLGTNRATAVMNYLIGRGVKKDHISAVGIGQGRPVADNKSAEGRANNRRVEIIITPIERR
jgi:outer membrane protein OmpA-like peptidoglycan-associated protein